MARKRKFPFMKFYPGDWVTDTEVSLLKPATRGIWMDAICAMHQLDQCGQIVGTVSDLSRICRCTSSEMRAALDDLKSRNAADVTECNNVVTLLNRRMRREWTDRKSTLERVHKHRSKAGTAVGNANVTDLKRGEARNKKPEATTTGPAPPDVAAVSASLEEEEGIEVLVGEGFHPDLARDLAAKWGYPQVEVAIKNANLLQRQGKVKERLGYIRKAIEDRYMLLDGVGREEVQVENKANAKVHADRQRRDSEAEKATAGQVERDQIAALSALPAGELQRLKDDVIASFDGNGVVCATFRKADPLKHPALRGEICKRIIGSAVPA